MTKKNILVLLAHPQLDRSEANNHLYNFIQGMEGVTCVDLYAEYPRFEIDVVREQERLRNHDVIIFQHPMYWYSTPAILKEWQDIVLEYGFAYGSCGRELVGKLFLSVITTGGPKEAFTREGYQHFGIRELLTPIQQTAQLCGMEYLPPLVLYAAGHAVDENRLEDHGLHYRELLGALINKEIDLKACAAQECMPRDLSTVFKGGR